MEWFIITILALLAIASVYFKIGDFFAPWNITIAVWLGIMVLSKIEEGLLYPIGPHFYTCLLIWIPTFCLSSVITFYLLPTKDNGTERIKSKDIAYHVFDLLLVFTLIATPVYLFQILKVVTMFDTTDLMYNLRLLAVSQEYDFGIVRYSYILNQALYVIAIWKYPKIPLWKIVLILIAYLMGQFALMEKSGIFLLVISTLFALYEKKIIKMRAIAFTFVGIILLFFIINFSKEIKSDTTAESMTLLDFIGVYILSPAVAFEYITPDLSNQFGAHTFEYFYNILNNLGIGKYIVYERLQEWVWVPLPTNVYTIFMPFYEDFGFKGIGYFGVMYGAFFSWIYKMFKNGSFIAACIYAFCSSILFVQFYHENFIMSIATFGQFALLIIFISQTRITVFPKKKGKINVETS